MQKARPCRNGSSESCFEFQFEFFEFQFSERSFGSSFFFWKKKCEGSRFSTVCFLVELDGIANSQVLSLASAQRSWKMGLQRLLEKKNCIQKHQKAKYEKTTDFRRRNLGWFVSWQTFNLDGTWNPCIALKMIWWYIYNYPRYSKMIFDQIGGPWGSNKKASMQAGLPTHVTFGYLWVTEVAAIFAGVFDRRE